jgi:hypothetical protein
MKFNRSLLVRLLARRLQNDPSGASAVRAWDKLRHLSWAEKESIWHEAESKAYPATPDPLRYYWPNR